MTFGTDFYTVSKLLGHNNLQTTQIYAKIIDEKKREAVNKIQSGLVGAKMHHWRIFAPAKYRGSKAELIGIKAVGLLRRWLNFSVKQKTEIETLHTTDGLETRRIKHRQNFRP